MRPETSRSAHRRHTNPAIDRRIQDSLRYSVIEGAFFSVMVGAAEGYFQAFAVFLKATVFQVGMASTLPISAASVLQLFWAPALKLLRSRKRLTIAAGIMRTALFVPLALVPFMGPARIWTLLALICLYFTLNYLPNPAWTSWMRDLVDESQRGSFFGRKNAAANLALLGSSVAAGLILQAYTRRPLYGFLVVFILAFLGCFGSTLFLSLQYDPEGLAPARKAERLHAFTRELTSTNYGRFVIYNFLLYFGAYLSSPFVVPYMLQELAFSYWQFMLATSLVSLFKFFFMPLWGELGDRYGNKKTLVLATLLIGLTPLSWLLGRSLAWICLIQAFGAFAWAGFEISALSFAYDVMPAARVIPQTSFLLFYRGLATIAGGLAGGLLMRHIQLAGSSYRGIFLVSGIFRTLFVVPLVLLIREERFVENISYGRLALKLFLQAPRLSLRRWFPR